MLLLHSCAARLTALASDNCLSVATITRYPHRRRRDAASRHYVFSRSVVFKNRFSQFDTCVVMPFRTIRCSWASRVKALQATKAVSWRKQLQTKREEKKTYLNLQEAHLRCGEDETKNTERERKEKERGSAVNGRLLGNNSATYMQASLFMSIPAASVRNELQLTRNIFIRLCGGSFLFI